MESVEGPGLPPSLADLQMGGPISLFLDFDGTLVDIAPGPDDIHVPETLIDGLHRLRACFEGRLALISGRALDDIARHIDLSGIARAGSHGADCRDKCGSSLGQAARAIDPLMVDRLEGFAVQHGIELERKSHGAALHFRSQPDLEPQAINFASGLAQSNGLAIKTGKCVVEIMAKGADKGRAVDCFMQTEPFVGSRPWFVGDDVTDEDGFAACARLGGGGILVGHKDKTSAQFGLPDVAGVHRWLGL